MRRGTTFCAAVRSPAPVDGFDLDGLFSVHRLKQSVQNLTVQRPGDIVMLEHKVFLMGIGFIQQKTKKNRLRRRGRPRKKVKRICTGRLSRGRTAVQQCFADRSVQIRPCSAYSFSFCGRWMHRMFSARQKHESRRSISSMMPLSGSAISGPDKNIEDQKMKRDIPIGKAFRFPCLVERIVMRNTAVDGEKDLLPSAVCRKRI